MIYLQWASGLLLALAGYICCLNFYLSFLRYPLYLWRGGSKEAYRFISGIPILGSLVMYFLYRYAQLPEALQILAIVMMAVDTGGIHWGIANMIFQGSRSLLRRAVSNNLISSAYADELCFANAPVSLSLYWMCGLVWYWQGSLAELLQSIQSGLKRTP